MLMAFLQAPKVRETTLAYRSESSSHGTLVIVREEVDQMPRVEVWKCRKLGEGLDWLNATDAIRRR